MVPVRPLGHPRDHIAFYGCCTGSPSLVQSVGCAIHAVPVRGGYPPIFLFAGGPVFEEIGWRGFALPRLQLLHGPLVGSLLLGVLWALWHLPLFLIPSWDTPHGSLLDVALFIIWAVAITVIFTWVFNNTKGSVLLAILAHGSVNSASVAVFGLFPAPAVTGGITNFVIGFGVAALVIVALTRGRLGYRQEEGLGAA